MLHNSISIKNISSLGRWSTSSGKKKTLNMLLNANDEYYQSCSPSAPHTIYVDFEAEKYVDSVKIKLDLADETYLPDEIEILGGSHLSMVTITTKKLPSPVFEAWVIFDINYDLCALAIRINSVKSGGQDVRLSQIQILGY
eukprot:NODE_3_length_80033_cov_0.932970.p61 type:complete len:141 gc:universal NODE_3_length_80033_cov_0.932970:73596-74018(+)